MEEGNIRNDTNGSQYRETVLSILRDVEPALIAAEATTTDVDDEDSVSGEDVDAEHLLSSVTIGITDIGTRELLDVRENVSVLELDEEWLEENVIVFRYMEDFHVAWDQTASGEWYISIQFQI